MPERVDTVAPADEYPRLMDINTTAEYLGIGRTKLFALMKEGALGVSPRRIGGRRMFSRPELDAWLAAQSKGDWG